MIDNLQPNFDETARKIYEQVTPAKRECQLDLTRFVAEEKIRRTYPQDWWAYNQAQTREKLLFQSILLELANAIAPSEINKKVGRHGLAKKEKLFCVGLYSYGCFSSRRSISDLEIAKKSSYISTTPHFNTISNYLNETALTPLLTQMIEISSLPLRIVEKDFAVDSTGFSTPRFERWFNVRLQKKTKQRMWKKAHMIIGTKTNVITSITITDGVIADCPHLIPLVERTKTYFDMREVSADKAYSSRENMNFISQSGAIPFIPFKSNAIGASKGSMVWSRMYEFFKAHKNEFERHYHKRSNIESTNSMIKRKFSNHLKTKKPTAQVNEILVKCLCHNLCILIQEAFERGIDIDLDSCAEAYFAQK